MICEANKSGYFGIFELDPIEQIPPIIVKNG